MNRPDQLSSSDPADWPVAPGWQPLVDDFFAGVVGQKLLGFLRERLDAHAVIFPPQPLRALELTPPEDVRVVILGQDLPRSRTGRRTRVLGRARRGAAAVAAHHLQRASARPWYGAAAVSESGWQPGEVGDAWRAAAQHLPHGGRSPAGEPFRAGLGSADRCRHPTCIRRRKTCCFYAVGFACAK